MGMLSQVQELAAQLVIDDLGDVNPELDVSKETSNRSDDRPMLFDRGSYDLPEDVAVEKKRERHRSAELRSIPFQISFKFPPELPFLFGGRPVQEREK